MARVLRWMVERSAAAALGVAAVLTAALVAAALVGGTGGVVTVLAVLVVVAVAGAVAMLPRLRGAWRRALTRASERALEAAGRDSVDPDGSGSDDAIHLADRVEHLEHLVALLREQRIRAGRREVARLRADGRPDAAVEALEELIELLPEDGRLRDLHVEAVAARHADAGPGRGFARAVDRRLRARDVVQAHRLTEHGLELAPGSLRLQDRRVALLQHQGDHEQALHLALAAARARVRLWRTRRPADRPTRRLDVATRVAISGFFYSGSGAAKDHLRGFEDVTVWPPSGEVRVVKFPGGYGDLAERLALQGTLRDADLVDHYLHLVGRRITTVEPGVYDQWDVVNRSSRRLLRGVPDTAGYLAALAEGFLGLHELAQDGSLDGAGFDVHARSVLAAALDSAATDTDRSWLVMDQVVTAWRLELARLLPPSSFVLVHRDPRDRFAEVREVLAQPGRSAQGRDPAAFARKERRTRQQVDEQVAEVQALGHRVLRLAFEDLVLEPDRTLAELETFLGLDGRRMVERRFQPERSRRNVGKHVAFVPPEELRVLERELAELLDPRAVPLGDGGSEGR